VKKQRKEKKQKKKRTMEMKKIAEEWKFGMKRRRQKNLKKRLKNWFLKGFTNESVSSKRKQVRECQQRRYLTM